MSNSLGGVNLARISNLALDVLLPELAPLRAFHTDFSGEIKESGESVTTRVAGVLTTQDFATSKTPGNATLTPIKVDVDDYRGVSLGFTDKELSYTDVKLTDEFIRPAISALVEYVTTKCLELVLAATYTQGTVITSAAMDADAVADLATALTTAKVGKNGRALLLPPAHYGSLSKDAKLGDASAYGADGVTKEHRIPVVHGFSVVEYNGNIPDNGENLVGIAAHPSGICIAARGVATPPPGTWYGKVLNVVEPVSGLPLQFREYYDGSNLRFEVSILFGVKEGIAGAIHRIKSA